MKEVKSQKLYVLPHDEVTMEGLQNVFPKAKSVEVIAVDREMNRIVCRTVNE